MLRVVGGSNLNLRQPSQLVKHRVSDNVGPCQALLHALEEERHFALSLVIVFQVRNSVGPMHLFGHNRDHHYFELRGEGDRDTLSITR